MINIVLNRLEFEYDIMSIVKAFYPEEKIKISEALEDDNSMFINYNKHNIAVSYLGDELSIDNDFSDRKETKNNLKKVIYKLLNKKLHKDLPWGTLTGIRPVKIPEMLIGNGVGRDEIEKIMKSDYLIGDEKMNLAIDIAYRQKELLDKINYKDGYSIDVGIAFCSKTCLYYGFT